MAAAAAADLAACREQLRHGSRTFLAASLLFSARKYHDETGPIACDVEAEVGRNAADAIDSFTRDLVGFHKADAAHYNALLHGCIEAAETLDAAIVPLLDRKMAEISPIERSVMWIGAYEMSHCLDVPWRVVLNDEKVIAITNTLRDAKRIANENARTALLFGARPVEIKFPNAPSYPDECAAGQNLGLRGPVRPVVAVSHPASNQTR